MVLVLEGKFSPRFFTACFFVLIYYKWKKVVRYLKSKNLLADWISISLIGCLTVGPALRLSRWPPRRWCLASLLNRWLEANPCHNFLGWLSVMLPWRNLSRRMMRNICKRYHPTARSSISTIWCCRPSAQFDLVTFVPSHLKHYSRRLGNSFPNSFQWAHSSFHTFHSSLMERSQPITIRFTNICTIVFSSTLWFPIIHLVYGGMEKTQISHVRW